MSNTPGDAEIESLWDCYVGEPTAKLPLTRGDKFAFACAVLAKWGTPQPVVREPLTANQVSELANSAGYWHGDTSRADFINGIRYAEATHGIAQKGGS